MSTLSSSISRRASDIVSDQFPVGLRVLAVDDDLTCLKILEKMLRKCLYEVTKCQRAEVALSILRESKTGFDIVISDVHMPDMDGFKLLEHIGLEMDLPVIMISADEGKDVVMKGVTHGACDYLIKPLRIEAIRNIWQHVVRKRSGLKDLEQSGSVEDDDEQQRQKLSGDTDYASSANEGDRRNSKRKMDGEVEGEDRDDMSTTKKPRVVWTFELHQQFVAAVNRLGIEKAVPKRILELMNVPGITRENVASHLQKYRLYLRRISGQQHHQSGLSTPFMSPEEVNFGLMSSLDGLDLQTLAVSGQLPQKGLTTLPAGFERSIATSGGMDIPFVDEKNFFNFETTRLRFGVGQQLLSNISQQVDLLHGLPTTMEPKQLAHSHQSVQSFGNVGLQVSERASSFLNLPMSIRTSSLMMPMAQPQSRGQILNEIAGGHTLTHPSSMDDKIFPNEIGSWVLGRNEIINGGHATCYPISQATLKVDFVNNHATELPGNCFRLRDNTAMVPLSQENEHQEIQNPENTAQCRNYSLIDDFYRIKAENMPDLSSETELFGEHFGQDDLMNALLKQQQDDVGYVENEFNFDGSPMDNISA